MNDWKFRGVLLAGTVCVLSGCMTPDAYKQATGIDTDNYVGINACKGMMLSGADATVLQSMPSLRADRAKCAEANSGKVIATDSEMRYSVFRDGYESICYFAGYDRTVVIDRIGKGVGLVQPVIVLSETGAYQIDAKATQALIGLMKNRLKMNVRPYADSLRYFNLLMAYNPPEGPAAGTLLGAASNMTMRDDTLLHYEHVLSKFPGVDFLVAPSEKLVKDRLLGNDKAVREAYAVARRETDRLTDPNTRTFKPTDIQLLMQMNRHLQGIVVENTLTAELTIQLTERMKNYNPAEDGMLAKLARSFVRNGCVVMDITRQATASSLESANVASSDNKTYAQRLGEMFKLSDGPGGLLNLEISNENALRDSFLKERKMLLELVKLVRSSADEKYLRINNMLVPFTSEAFDRFRVTGYTRSKPL